MRIILVALMAMIGAALAADKAPPSVSVYLSPAVLFLTIFRLQRDNLARRMAAWVSVQVASAWYVPGVLSVEDRMKKADFSYSKLRVRTRENVLRNCIYSLDISNDTGFGSECQLFQPKL
jgi:hypothetical protein